MRWAPQSVPWNDLQASRSLVRASALWSVISDRTPWLSSSSPVLHKQEQSTESTQSPGEPRSSGEPLTRLFVMWAHRTAAAGPLLLSVPTPTSPRDKSILRRRPGEPSPSSLQPWPGQTRAWEIWLPKMCKCTEAHIHERVWWESQETNEKKWSKSHLWKDNGHGFSKTVRCVTSILLI